MSKDLTTYINLIIASGPGVYYSDQGGYFAGVIDTRESEQNGLRYLLFVAPKSIGESESLEFGYYDEISGATSLWNGYANTQKLVNSPAAKFCRNIVYNDLNDYYLPAKDELEILYRVLKPSSHNNWDRSGENNSSYPKTQNYTENNPSQMIHSDFQMGGSEAFTANYYWSSTELNSTNSWSQYFFNGYQNSYNKNNSYYVRAVRRLTL